MNIYRLSASNIGVFFDCPYKYRLKYHDRKKEIEPPNPWGPIGTAVHTAIMKYLTEHPEPPISDNFLLAYVAKEFTVQGIGISAYKEWSQLLKTWIKKVKPPAKIIGIEQKIEMDLPNGIPVIMYLDLVEEIDEDTIRIRDWKTGRVPDVEEMAENIQAPMYILGTKLTHPDKKKINFVFEYIRGNVALPYTYTDTSMKEFVRFLEGVYGAITDMNPDDAKPRLGRHCMFCGYHDECPAMIEARAGKMNIPSIESESLEGMIGAQQDVDGMVKGLDNESKRLRDMIKERLSRDGLEEYKSDSFLVKMSQTRYINYDPITVIKVLNKDVRIEDVVKIQKANMDKLLPDLTDDQRNKIEDSTSVSYSREFIRITNRRKSNGGKAKTKKTGYEELL